MKTKSIGYPKILLPLPTSVNASYARNGSSFYKTAKARDWEKEASSMLINYKTKHSLILEPVKIYVDFFFKRDRDIDGGLKILLDFMQGRLIKNDSQITELIVRKFSDKENPRVEIELETLSE